MAEATDDQMVAAVDAVGVETQIDAWALAPGVVGVRPMLRKGRGLSGNAART